MISIVNYGVGNLASVQNILKKVGIESALASDTASIENATKIILPGIGAFDHCMQRFNGSGLRNLVEKRVKVDKIPLCLGFALDASNADGEK